MKYVDHTLVSPTKDKELYDYCLSMSALTKNLRNAALFRMRQIFTGWERPETERTQNQKDIFAEVALLQEMRPSVKIRRTISRTHLEALMRATENPDFFSGLPMQAAQQVLIQVVREWKSWLSSLREYKKHPEKYLGRPRMPGYTKSGLATVTITNQDAVLYPIRDKDGRYHGMSMKLPLLAHRVRLSHLPENARLREVKIKPYYGKFILSLTLESCAPPFFPDMPNLAGVDFGQDNIAALVCTDGSSVVYKGGAVLAENQMFAKCKASAISDITRGHEHMRAASRHLDRLSLHHAMFVKDQMHKISTSIIRFCVEHKAGVLVIGANKGWKQKANMGRRSNQNFVSIPLYMLRQMLNYKAMIAGISVIEQEESYTSRADITASDPIPVYGHRPEGLSFSGRRVSRGLYQTSAGYRINADCNGAANILRKAIPDAWKGTKDFRFLAFPERMDFNSLNRERTA